MRRFNDGYDNGHEQNMRKLGDMGRSMFTIRSYVFGEDINNETIQVPSHHMARTHFASVTEEAKGDDPPIVDGDTSDGPSEPIHSDIHEPPIEYKTEYVNGRIRYVCQHGSCADSGDVRFSELHRLNRHRQVEHNLPSMEPRKHGRKHTGKRSPISQDRSRAYVQKREADVNYVLRQRFYLQRRRVIDRVCKKECKYRFEELSREGKREVDDAMRAYDSAEMRK
ncbi:hypothetical protein KI387_043098, partial [Taxus chinensis]